MFDQTHKALIKKEVFCPTVQLDIWCKHLTVVSMKKAVNLKIYSCTTVRFLDIDLTTEQGKPQF